MSEMVSAAEAPLMPSDVGVVFGVGGKDERNHLGFATEAFLEQRPHRAVDLAAGENFALAGPAFALDEAAGNASAGVGVFAIINGQREEVDAFAWFGIRGGGCENDVVAHSYNDGAVGLLGQFSGFK